jgi:hypothetical protein
METLLERLCRWCASGRQRRGPKTAGTAQKGQARRWQEQQPARRLRVLAAGAGEGMGTPAAEPTHIVHAPCPSAWPLLRLPPALRPRAHRRTGNTLRLSCCARASAAPPFTRPSLLSPPPRRSGPLPSWACLRWGGRRVMWAQRVPLSAIGAFACRPLALSPAARAPAHACRRPTLPLRRMAALAPCCLLCRRRPLPPGWRRNRAPEGSNRRPPGRLRPRKPRGAPAAPLRRQPPGCTHAHMTGARSLASCPGLHTPGCAPAWSPQQARSRPSCAPAAPPPLHRPRSSHAPSHPLPAWQDLGRLAWAVGHFDLVPPALEACIIEVCKGAFACAGFRVQGLCACACACSCACACACMCAFYCCSNQLNQGLSNRG